MDDMLEVFGAAAEQMRLEEKDTGSESKKHETIISKLDKIIEQNKTIAEGMVAIVEMERDRISAPAKEREESFFKPKEKEESFFKPAPEPKPFMRPAQPQWQPSPEPMMPRAQQVMPPPITIPPMPPPPPSPDFGMQMPPMEPEPSPEMDFPEDAFSVEEEPKKKGLFGMFKK